MNDKQNITTQLVEIESRWMEFLAKMEERLKELGEAAVTEIKENYNNASDVFQKGNFISGMIGQINSMEVKAEMTGKKNVFGAMEELEARIDDMDDDSLSTFFERVKDNCEKRGEVFFEKIEYWTEKIKQAGEPDYEQEYKAVMDEYERIKDKFSCKQCGSPITIPQLFLTTAHISCPACRTQNTFEPSTRALSLDNIGRLLAERRTAYLLEAYDREIDNEREIYFRIHKLELQKISANDKKEIDKQIDELIKQRQESLAKAPQLYKQYLKAMFDEWMKLVPQLAEQNRKAYDSQLNEFEKRKK